MSDPDFVGCTPYETLMARLEECSKPEFVEQLRDTLKHALLDCPWRLQKYLGESAENVKDLVATSFDTTTPGGRVQARGYEIMLAEEVALHCKLHSALRPVATAEGAFAPANSVEDDMVVDSQRGDRGKLPASTESDCNSPGEGKSKRLKITPKIEHAYQLQTLPAELVASAERLKGRLTDDSPVLKEINTRPWVRQAMEWCLSQGILNQTDNAGVLGKVGDEFHVLHCAPHTRALAHACTSSCSPVAHLPLTPHHHP